MFNSNTYNIAIFPYRMQAVALWDEATNWRVLQASAHQDIWNSFKCFENSRWGTNEKDLNRAPHGVNIFDHCAELSKQSSLDKGLLGVVIEPVRTFLAEWVSESEREPV